MSAKFTTVAKHTHPQSKIGAPTQQRHRVLHMACACHQMC